MRYLIIGLLFITSTLFAQSDKQSSTILNKVSSEMKAMSSFYMEFTVHTKNSATGEDSNIKGSGYVKGNKYYAVLGNNTLISNGFKSWSVVKDEKVTYQNDVDPDDDDAITPKKLMTIWENGFKSKYNKEVKIDGKSYHQIDLFPTNPANVNYHTITLFIGTETNQLYRAIMKTKDGGIVTYTINNFVKNKPVSDSQFVYNPQEYPGYKLIRD